MDMKLVFDAIRVSAGNSYCWETEVPRMLKGDYYPDFTAQMMAKDISLGLALGKKYDVPQEAFEFIAKKYQEAMDMFGPDSGSAIPCRLVEEKAGCRLIEGEGKPDLYPGNSVCPESHGGCFKDWSYTTEINNGSYTVIHTGYDNVFKHFENPKNSDLQVELEYLRKRVEELEKTVAQT